MFSRRCDESGAMSRRQVVAFLVTLCLYVSASQGAPSYSTGIGYFWQVTDFHFDANYSTSGDPASMCHLSNAANGAGPGVFGDFSCDSPWLLVSSAIDAMRSHNSKPDFIFWTGDTTPHVPDSMLDDHTVVSLIRNLSLSLLEAFPNSIIYPSFGNHDVHPSGMMPGMNTTYYDRIWNASGWKYLLPAGSSETFKKGGYYSYMHSPKLKILSLNTAMYYFNDNATAQLPDPADQLAWLEKQLQDARNIDAKVYLAAHVPPGIFEGLPNQKFMQEIFNARFTAILLSYSDVIAGQFYGHAHTDSFRLISDSSVVDAVSGGAFLCPSVTPIGGTRLGRNPSVRMYAYDRTTLNVLDYVQYYFNLTAANAAFLTSKQAADDASKFWLPEYNFTSAYSVPDASAASMLTVWRSFSDGTSPTFQTYLGYNTVGQVDGPCNFSCVAWQICAIGHVGIDAYRQCVENFGPRSTSQQPPTGTAVHSTRHPHRQPAPNYMHYVIAALAGASVVAAIAVIAVCFRHWQLKRHGSSQSSGSYERLK